MNYRHAFHAGNHADVLKHLTLTSLLRHLTRKEASLAYLDSHSGVGLYDLAGDEASRTDEWSAGIGRLWDLPSWPEPAASYRALVASLNEPDALRYYPGSPEVARRLLRSQDRILLNEKHPEDGAALKDNMAGDARVAVHRGEGWHVPRAFLPAPEKRALLLIDPPFEAVDEMERAVRAMDEAIGRMRQCVIALWYPIKDRRQLKRFEQDMKKSRAPKILQAELWVHPTDNATGLNGSGLAIVNPPWGLEDDLRTLLPWLAEHLAQTQGGWRLQWLVGEA